MYSLDISDTISCAMFGRMRQSNGWEDTRPRSFPSNLFVLIIDGSASFYIENVHYPVSAGDIIIVPASTVYYAMTETTCEYYFFHFSGKIKKEDEVVFSYKPSTYFSFFLPECKRDRLFFELKTSDGAVFKKICASALACVEYNSYSTQTGRLMLDNEFMKIMLILSSLAEKPIRNFPVTLEKMITYIKTNLDRPITLSEVSAVCNTSPQHAARLFRKHLNMTASEYINSEKLYYACELIKNSSMSISEIADYLAYCDIYYFSKIFKKKFGKSPSQYFSKR